MDGKQEQSGKGLPQEFSIKETPRSVINTSNSENTGIQREKRPSPKLLQRGLDMLTSLVSRRVEVSGKENLGELKADDNIIFAVLHKHDSSMTIASSVLAKEFPIVISHQSTHNELKVMLKKLDPTGMLVKLLGKENFVSVNYVYDKKRNQVVPKFDVDDYKNMKEVVEEKGKALVIAAHNPSMTGDVAGPAGLAVAAAASQIENAKIVPVYVDFDDPDQTLGLASNIVNTMRKRAPSRVVFGKPFQLEPIALDRIEGVEKKRALRRKVSPEVVASLALDDEEKVMLAEEVKNKSTVSAEDRLAVKVVHQKLKDHATRILTSIQQLRPPQKAA